MITVLIDDNNKECDVVTLTSNKITCVFINSYPPLTFKINISEEKYHKLIRQVNNYNVSKSTEL